MSRDPIVDEVRSIRKALVKEYPTWDALHKHLLRVQHKYQNRIVSRKPQPTLRKEELSSARRVRVKPKRVSVQRQGTATEVREPAAKYGKRGRPEPRRD